MPSRKPESFTPPREVLEITGDEGKEAPTNDELMREDLVHATETLKAGFGKWLAVGKGFEDLGDKELANLKTALDEVVVKSRIGGMAMADVLKADEVKRKTIETVEHIKANTQVKPEYATTMLHLMEGPAAPVCYIDLNEHGISQPRPHSELGITVDIIAAAFGDKLTLYTEPFPAIRENIDELTFLNDRLSKLATEASISPGLINNISSILEAYFTDRQYPVKDLSTIKDATTQSHLTVDSLLRSYNKMKLALGLATVFEEATGSPTLVRSFEREPDIKNFLVENWAKTTDSLAPKKRRAFEDKYSVLFSTIDQLSTTEGSFERSKITDDAKVKIAQEQAVKRYYKEELPKTRPETFPDEPETYEEEP